MRLISWIWLNLFWYWVPCVNFDTMADQVDTKPKEWIFKFREEDISPNDINILTPTDQSRSLLFLQMEIDPAGRKTFYYLLV